MRPYVTDLKTKSEVMNQIPDNLEIHIIKCFLIHVLPLETKSWKEQEPPDHAKVPAEYRKYRASGS